MNDIDTLWRLDLNLLVVLDVLYETRSASAAARRLGRTQSSISHALGRLRRALEDELFRPTSTGLAPTPRGIELCTRVHALLPELAAAVAARPAFEPSTTRARVRIIASDLVQHLLLGALCARLATRAPSLGLHLLPYGLGDEPRALRDGRADLWLQVPPISDEAAGAVGASRHLSSVQVYEDGFVGVAARGHRGLRELTLARYAKLRHVLVAPRGLGGSFVDSYLAGRGLERQIDVTVSAFLAVAEVIAGSERVVTLPTSFARRLVRADRRLVTFELPFTSPRFRTHCVWDERAASPAALWIRDQIIAVLQPRA